MTRSPRLAAAAALLVTLTACAERAWMMVPPDFDLADFDRIGLSEFQCTDRALQQRATEQFHEMILGARPTAQVIEIGAVGAGESGALDLDAVRALAKQHDLDAIFIGSLEFSDLTPTVGIATSLVEVNARAEVLGTMRARLVDTAGGATIWLRSAEERMTVAQGSVNSEGVGSVGITDPTGVRSSMVHGLASQVTHDFWPQYFRKKLEDIPPHYRSTYQDGVEIWVPPPAAE